MNKDIFTQADNKLITLKDILERYRKDITSKKRGREQEEYRIKQMMRHSISLKEITVLSPTHFAYYRDERLKQVSPTTVRKECALFSHAINVAAKTTSLSFCKLASAYSKA